MYSDSELMISVSGVRGILGAAMNPEAAVRFAASYARISGAKEVVIGRDTRASGPAISTAVTSVLLFMGIDVIDAGIASTPTVEIMVGHAGAGGGIIITASHNDEKWNALKFLDGAGEFLSAEKMSAIGDEATGRGQLFTAPGPPGSYRRTDEADEVHIGKILSLECIDQARISSRGFKAVVDCVNGAGSRILPALLGRLGVETVELYTDMDKPFPRDPEPKPSALTELSARVVKEKADIGFACDPDADRLVLVDANGVVCSEELTVSLAADFVLSKEKGPVVANLSTTRLIDDIARRHGVRPLRSKVGEANVIEVMKSEGAVIGGEGNGGVIYPRVHYGRDAMTGAALILQMLAEDGETLEKKIGGLPDYKIVKEKLPFSGRLDLAVDALKKEFDGSFDLRDGIRIDMDSGWVHLRRSNTEPVVRIIAEAGGYEEAGKLAARARSILEAFG